MELITYARFLRDQQAFREADRLALYALNQFYLMGDESLYRLASIYEGLASVANRQADYGREAYWRVQMLIAGARHFGWRHNYPINTARNLAITCGFLATQTAACDPLPLATGFVTKWWQRRNDANLVPIVVENSGVHSLQWVDSSSEAATP